MKYIKTIALILLFASCSRDYDRVSLREDTTIPVEEALGSLQKFLDNQNKLSPGTRSSSNRNIESITTVKYSDIFGSNLGNLSDRSEMPAVYVVNYENDEGYAILSANSNIADQIIAVTEKGTIDSSFSISSNEDSGNEAIIDEEFRSLVKALLIGYIARDGIEGNRGGVDTGFTPDDGTMPPDPEPPQPTLYNIGPLFPNWWDQHSPFNTYCYNYLDNQVSTGCLPLALSMSLTHYCNESGMTLSSGEHYYDFEEMSLVWLRDGLSINYGSSTGIDDVALFISENGSMIGAYGYGLHPTMMSTASFLNNIGFDSVSVHSGYDQSDIIIMLQSDKPIIISGFPSALALTGHAWIIDGIMQYTENNHVVSLVHCNWGQGGTANGYYTSGVFTPMDGAISYDNNYDANIGNYSNTLDENYQHRIKYITY